MRQSPIRRVPHLRTLTAAVGMLVATAFTPAAQALELHGVTVPAQLSVDGQPLSLNGAGTRYFFIFKVYVAALYLPHKASQAASVYAMQGPKAIKLTMLREVSGKELGDKLNEDIKKNLSPAEFAEFIPSLAQLGAMFSARSSLKEGETVTIAQQPGKGGSVISIDGKPAGEPFTDPEFFNAFLKIWLGKDPADSRLKGALLGNADDTR